MHERRKVLDILDQRSAIRLSQGTVFFSIVHGRPTRLALVVKRNGPIYFKSVVSLNPTKI